MKTVTVIKYP